MKVYCPYCKKDVEYSIEKRDLNFFKGIQLNTFENIGVCNTCYNDLYITELESENTKRIYNLYREKTNIIKPDQIVKLREKYSISQRELTAILGFGKMTINRYENGGIPTKSQSDYMKLLIENDTEFKKKVEEAYQAKRITTKTYEKIIQKSQNQVITEDVLQAFYKKYINSILYRQPDIYNGYKSLNLELVENLISYIASKVKNLTLTSLSKYLWFIDIVSFNKRGVSITGLTYQKQQYGPTISDFKYSEISMLEEKYKRIDYEDESGTKTKFESNNNYDLSGLSEDELKIVDYVVDLLKNMSVTEISELSHKEDGWKKTKKYENISFEYAENLRIEYF